MSKNFWKNKTYPKGTLKDKDQKSNFRKAYKNFSVINWGLIYKEKRRVVFKVERRTAIIDDVHKGIGNDSMAKALVPHRDRESMYQKISERVFWHGMIEDNKKYIKICKSC